MKRKILSKNSKHVAAFIVAEEFRQGQRGQSDAGARAGRLVHLAINQRGFVDNPRLFHFQPKIVAFARALADAAEDRVTAVLHGDVVDQLHQNNRLAHAGAAEQADLAAASIGSEQIDDFDAGFERLNFGFLIDEFRRRAMNRIALLGVDRAHFVDRLTNDVEHASQRFFTHGHGNAGASVHDVHAPHQPFSSVHGNAAYGVFTQVLCDFHDQVPLLVADRRVGNF